MLKKADEPITEIRPTTIRKGSGRTLGEVLASLPPLTEEEAADFARDIEEMRPPARLLELPDPWEF